ncbi:hypothetical protein ACIQUF_00495 [Pseudomonas sp. NPDC090233]|uniref:hypothetical protein n=1 Tax=Pseudomonas sp. NPDC090233 TaxID=3364479 RepID=UPI00383AC75D
MKRITERVRHGRRQQNINLPPSGLDTQSEGIHIARTSNAEKEGTSGVSLRLRPTIKSRTKL